MKLSLDEGHFVDEGHADQCKQTGQYGQKQEESDGVRVQEGDIYSCVDTGTQSKHGFQDANDSTPVARKMTILSMDML